MASGNNFLEKLPTYGGTLIGGGLLGLFIAGDIGAAIGAILAIALCVANNSSRRRQEKRIHYQDGVVTWIAWQTYKDTDQVGITLQERGRKVQFVFCGLGRSVPSSVKEGSVVRIKYILPNVNRMLLQVKMLEVEHLEETVCGMERELFDLRVRVDGLRGGKLPERTKDDLS